MTDLKIGGGERSGLRLFEIFGIEIRLDISVAIIFALIVFSLARGLFPSWHPDWTPATVWLTAVGAGLVFFASLLAHELAHSLTAQRYGIRVPRITLFLFGGVAEIESEAETPNAEFTIAIAGPLMSVLLGLAFGIGAVLTMSDATLALLAEDPQRAMSTLNPLQTASVWLGSVNLVLAVFNMVPGFPLDGGRVFRALIWKLTGNALLATRIAASSGRGFGWILMGYGLWTLLAERNPGGLWFLLIGWFLSHLAWAGYRQMQAQRTLGGVRLADLMRTRFECIDAGTPLETFIEDYLLRSNQQLWPVLEHDRLLGTISLATAAAAPLAERGTRRVGELATPLERSRTLAPDTSAADALRLLAGPDDQPALVVQGGRAVGLVRGSDILRWIMLHRDRAVAA